MQVDSVRLHETALPLCRVVGQRGAGAAAAKVLGAGGVVAFPTETVYGLAVRYGDRRARARLAQVKHRPHGRPFQILLSSSRRLGELCHALPEAARTLARTFWPGPLTLVVRAKTGRWLGLRVPDHPAARDLARRAGGMLVATSANLSGRRPARNADEVIRALGANVDFVLDGGAVGRGTASSVVRVSQTSWQLLREGAISRKQIENVLGSGPTARGARK